ncbi:MAG TPA: alpha/beta fold hydrolase [bacterium]|nr:alpha/beta fold hydrolase [bacterium]
MHFTEHAYHYVDNKAGWKLELKQCRPPKKLRVRRNPVAIIPGYGMNSFIFGYHPRGLSMEDYLTEKGFEVWSINLRGQGGSQSHGGHRCFGLRELALDDLSAALHYIARVSRSRTGKVDVIGCSLGGTLSFIHAALRPHNNLGSIVAMGAPLRWETVHPLLRIVFYSPALIGLIPVPHTRTLLRILAPFFMDSPLLKLYLHREIVDLKNKDVLLETVEDPNRFVNREIAQWIRNKDLMIDRKNVTQEFRKSKNPLLCVVANADGIVPPMTALSAEETSGSKVKETLVVGTDRLRFAHADLFISNHSHDLVFKPTADWLLKMEGS